MKTDIEIALSVQGLAIEEIARKIDIPGPALELYGKTNKELKKNQDDQLSAAYSL